MLAALSSREISEWMLYEQMEPFGERSAWLRTGILAALIYNVNRGPDDAARTPEDFMPDTMSAKHEEESAMQEFARSLGLVAVRTDDGDDR